MTITTRDQMVDALGNNSSRLVIDKASLANAVAGQFFSLWTSAGTPGAGSAPWVDAVSNRAVPQGALSLVTSSPGADRLGDANYSDVQWWLEIYTALGATGVNATVAVTYNDDSTGNLTAFALGATPRAGRLYPLVPAVAGKFIKAVTGVTLSATTGTAGNFGITATRPRTSVSVSLANKTETFNWADLGFPNVPNDSCLQMLMCCSTTSTGTVRGQGKIAHG